MSIVEASVAPGKSTYRTDIQALRGVAVLLVVLYHSGLKVFDSGYLGVDLFFVISGFLITGIITRAIVAERFSFADFYARRARRLLPAAYVVLVATTIGAIIFLTTSQYRQFFTNLIGAVTFSANFTLWSQTGYFNPNSAYGPLLHTWSLAVEEQYYLLIPILLTLLPRRTWLPLVSLATVISLVVCFYLAGVKPSVAFFWLPTRAWELGIGSIAALIAEFSRVRRITATLLWPAIVVIAAVPVWVLPGPTPGLGSLLVCLATAIIILARDPRADRSIGLQILAKVGDISYSLYLVHWPIFALTRASRLTVELPTSVSVMLIAASLAAAYLLYEFVEQPLRRSRLSGTRLVMAGLCGAALIVGFGWLGLLSKPDVVRRAGLDSPVEGLKLPGCFSEDELRFKGMCTQSPNPVMLLWGDSYSAHLVPGLEATSLRPFAQASKGHCSPLVDYAAVASDNEFEWSKDCIRHTDSVIAYVQRTKSLKVVILSGQYFRTLANAGAYAVGRDTAGVFSKVALGLRPTIVAQRATIARLRALGMRVIVVSPPPPSEFDLGRCWERQAELRPIFGPHRNCELRTDNSARRSQQFNEMMAQFRSVANVPVIRIDGALCDPQRCVIEADDKPLFRDDGHLTTWGSLVVGRRLNLGERAWREAR